MKTFIISTLMLLISASSFATTKVCSNAEQTFSYNYFVSSGGAYMKRETVKLNDNEQTVMNNNGKLDIAFSAAKKIKSVNSTETISVATVVGSVKVGNSKMKFSETVICKEVVTPQCVGPNGQPCP